MFSLEFAVRDYECDLQGIVNNSTYLNYLEHTRHQFLRSRNLDFATITASGVHLVVATMQLSYKKPLRPNDIFTSTLVVKEMNAIKAIFQQQLSKDNAIYLSAEITVVATNTAGKLIKIPEDIRTNLT